MKKCDHNCFECKYDDCIIENMSSEERKEISDRDKRYFNSISTTGSVVKARARRCKYRGNYVSKLRLD